jgi:hypothetical protein
VGSVDKKVRWLNKISLDSNTGYVGTHVARTDPRFLGDELPDKFSAFIIDLVSELNRYLEDEWLRFAIA